MRPVADIKFHIGEKTYRFLPGAVTPDDLPRLILLFMALTQPQGTFDVAGYMDEHWLWHCFEERT